VRVGSGGTGMVYVSKPSDPDSGAWYGSLSCDTYSFFVPFSGGMLC
jgi:hypothetical protein